MWLKIVQLLFVLRENQLFFQTFPNVRPCSPVWNVKIFHSVYLLHPLESKSNPTHSAHLWFPVFIYEPCSCFRVPSSVEDLPCLGAASSPPLRPSPNCSLNSCSNHHRPQMLSNLKREFAVSPGFLFVFPRDSKTHQSRMKDDDILYFFYITKWTPVTNRLSLFSIQCFY